MIESNNTYKELIIAFETMTDLSRELLGAEEKKVRTFLERLNRKHHLLHLSEEDFRKDYMNARTPKQLKAENRTQYEIALRQAVREELDTIFDKEGIRDIVAEMYGREF